MGEEEKTLEKKEKQKRCPFNPDLACEDCRLYFRYPGGHKDKVCVFLRMI